MDLDRICLWITAISCVVLLGRLAHQRFAGKSGWAAVCLLILAIDGVGYVVVPAQAGRIAGVVWAVLLVVPSWLTQLTARRIVQRRFAAARRYATLTWILHPFDGQWTVPIVVGALGLAHRGQADQAIAILTRLQDDPGISPGMKPVIAAHRARLAQDWAAIPALAAAAGNAASLVPPSMRLRALGETGRLRELVTEFRAVPASDRTDYQLCLLFLYAFCGRPDAMADALHGPLAALDADIRTFWLATADLANGGNEGRAALGALASRDGPIRDAARRRLDTALARPSDSLGPAELLIIDEAVAGGRRDADYRELAHAQWRRCYVVLALAAINVAVFGLELYRGDSESARVLYSMGAMWTEAIVKEGEWWRLGAALFLHAGPVHLGLNMLGLVVIGPWVEWRVGHWRLLLVYLGSGIGSMATVLMLVVLGLTPDGLLVGASGAIFGVVGAEVVLLAQGWRRLGSRLAARRLLAMGVLVATQVFFDLTTPQVSFAAHASGFAIGICLMAILLVIPRRTKT